MTQLGTGAGQATGRFDAQSARAWREFRSALADALDDLAHEGSVLLWLDQGEETGCGTPFALIERRADVLHVEVPANNALDPVRRMSRSETARLRALGLRRPARDSGRYRAEFPVRRVDEAAAIAVAALRESLGVLHPAFLGTSAPALTRLAQGAEPTPGESEPRDEAEEPTEVQVAFPADSDALDGFIAAALEPVVGHPAVQNADGEFALNRDDIMVFVRSAKGLPFVQIYSQMVVEIEDLNAATLEIATLNREDPYVKYSLDGTSAFAAIQVPATPFLPSHLLFALEVLCQAVAEQHKDLARRTRGVLFLDAAQRGGAGD